MYLVLQELEVSGWVDTQGEPHPSQNEGVEGMGCCDQDVKWINKFTEGKERALVVPAEDWVQFPACTQQLSTTCKSSSRRPDTSSASIGTMCT